jgi:hypothetical protein
MSSVEPCVFWPRSLERRDLVVDLGSVVEVVLVPAGSREEELHAVAAHAVRFAKGIRAAQSELLRQMSPVAADAWETGRAA